MTKILPLGNRVLVKQAKAVEKTAGGLFIPDTAQTDRNVEGEVLAVGAGRRSSDNGEVIPMTVQPGNRILFERHRASEVKIENEEFLIIAEDQIIAVFE